MSDANRYGTGQDDPEYEAGSNREVLRNHLGISNAAQISEIESELFVQAYFNGADFVGSDIRLTASLICELHRRWLGTLYPMAGKYRTVDLSKGGFTFCHALYIPAQMGRLEKEELKTLTPCRGTLDEVAEKLAVVHTELVLIHPFREGNGRLSRWVADLMANQAGLEAPKYDFSGDRKQEYFGALRQAFLGRTTELQLLFAAWLSAVA